MRQTADGDDAGRRKISNSRSTLPKGEKGDGQGKASRQPSHTTHIAVRRMRIENGYVCIEKRYALAVPERVRVSAHTI